MKLWLDEQLSPSLAKWIADKFDLEASAVREAGLSRASDRELFEAARKAGVVLLTKDADFVAIVERLGPPPQIIWLTCGNTSNANLKRLLQLKFAQAIAALANSEPIVELGME
jgi:predicted nuclease of predicted toxin-antitoxin system